MTPLELLTSERDKLINDLRKSVEAYKDNKIPWVIHEEHIMNIVPQIKIWNEAVSILKKESK